MKRTTYILAAISLFAAVVSCDKKVEPLSRWTFFAYRITKNIAIASDVSHSTTAIKITIP